MPQHTAMMATSLLLPCLFIAPFSHTHIVRVCDVFKGFKLFRGQQPACLSLPPTLLITPPRQLVPQQWKDEQGLEIPSPPPTPAEMAGFVTCTSTRQRLFLGGLGGWLHLP